MTRYSARVQKSNSLLCVGLDSDRGFAFNKQIIDSTHAFVAAYKPNAAFYEGAQGMSELARTMDYLHTTHPDIFTILDAKRGDIGNTNDAYVRVIFDELGFDAVTLHPYMGHESLLPFLDRRDKVSIILCRTSNPGAGELQDLPVDGTPLYQVLAKKVSMEWNKNENCMLVVGATAPEEMRVIRSIVGDITFLVPGIGAQGGDVQAVVTAGINSQKRGLIINSSRGIIFAPDPAHEAKKLRDEINLHRDNL